MFRGPARTLRYGRSWLTGRARVEERTLEVDRSDRTVPASLFVPRSRADVLPGWVVLHGITRPGRRHAQLVRFVRSLAASRAAVVVPEFPEWTELRLDSGATTPTVEGSVAALRTTGLVDPDAPVGLMGFSFGSPQALITCTDPRVEDDIAAVVGFGGYCDLERTIRFQLTGRHEWLGRERTLRPDPYGRWIVAANFLTQVPGFEDAGDVADALRELARRAGDEGRFSGDPLYDEAKRRLRRTVDRERRELFDLFAPPSTRDPGEEARSLVHPLVEAARRAEPLMEPAPHLGRVRRPVHLLHGRGDQLIPYTESLRLQSRLPEAARSRVTITGLFAHSAGDDVRSWSRRIREAGVFVAALGHVLTAV